MAPSKEEIMEMADKATDKLEDAAEEAVKKTSGFQQVANWASITLIPLLLGWAFLLQGQMGEFQTKTVESQAVSTAKIIEQLNRQEIADHAAFTTIAKNESTNMRQWQQLALTGTTAEGNKRALDMLQLFFAGDQLDFDKLEHAIQLVKAMEDSGLTPGEIETTLSILSKVKGINPFSAKPKPAPRVPKPPRPTRLEQFTAPNTSQRPATPSQHKMSAAELQRYMEAKIGQVKK